MRKIISSLILFLVVFSSKGQNVGINTTTPHPSAALDISDSTKGILIPRMTMSQRNNVQNPAEGLMVYQSDSTKGFWYFDGATWRNQNNYYVNNNSQNPLITINDYFIPNTNNYYWGEALIYSSNVSQNGFTDWHLPNKSEFISLLSKYGTSIFQTNDVVSYWTSSIEYAPHPQNNSTYPFPYIISINEKDYSNNNIGPMFSYGITFRYNGINPTKARLIMVR